MDDKDKEYRIQNLKASIDYEQRKLNQEKRKGITVNIRSRVKAIDKMQKELDQLIA